MPKEGSLVGQEERWRQEDSRKLFLGNLPTTDHTERAALREELEGFGPVEDLAVMPPAALGFTFGFVIYERKEHAEAALEALDGSERGGRRIRVEFKSSGRRRWPGVGFGGRGVAAPPPAPAPPQQGARCYGCGAGGHRWRECPGVEGGWGHQGAGGWGHSVAGGWGPPSKRPCTEEHGAWTSRCASLHPPHLTLQGLLGPHPPHGGQAQAGQGGEDR